jgi:hypothetical protein
MITGAKTYSLKKPIDPVIGTIHDPVIVKDAALSTIHDPVIGRPIFIWRTTRESLFKTLNQVGGGL